MDKKNIIEREKTDIVDIFRPVVASNATNLWRNENELITADFHSCMLMIRTPHHIFT